MASGFTRPLEVTNHVNKSYKYAKGGSVRGPYDPTTDTGPSDLEPPGGFNAPAGSKGSMAEEIAKRKRVGAPVGDELGPTPGRQYPTPGRQGKKYGR